MLVFQKIWRALFTLTPVLKFARCLITDEVYRLTRPMEQLCPRNLIVDHKLLLAGCEMFEFLFASWELGDFQTFSFEFGSTKSECFSHLD